MPNPGDTRLAPCTWCHEPDVLQTFRAYPREHKLPGGFWDTGACACSDPDRWNALGRKILRQHRDEAHQPKLFYKGVRRACVSKT